MAGDEIPRSGAAKTAASPTPSNAESSKESAAKEPSAKNNSTRRTKPKPDSREQGAEYLEEITAREQKDKKKIRKVPKREKTSSGTFIVALIGLIVLFVAIGILFLKNSSSDDEASKEKPNSGKVLPGTTTVHGQPVITDLSMYCSHKGDTDIYSFVVGEDFKMVDIGSTERICKWDGDAKIQVMDSQGNFSILASNKGLNGDQYKHVFMRVLPGSGTSMTVKFFPKPSYASIQPVRAPAKEYVLKVQNNKTGKSVSYAFGNK